MDQQALAHDGNSKQGAQAQGPILNALSASLNGLHILRIPILFGMYTHVDSAGPVGLAARSESEGGPTSPASDGALE